MIEQTQLVINDLLSLQQDCQ